MDVTCLEDCPPSLLLTLLMFFAIAAVGFPLARWRRWTLLLWLPTTFVLAAPFFSNGWAIDERGWTAMGCGWIVALVGGIRAHKGTPSKEAA